MDGVIRDDVSPVDLMVGQYLMAIFRRGQRAGDVSVRRLRGGKNGHYQISAIRSLRFLPPRLWPQDVMSQSTGTTDREYTTLVVTPEFRDKVRVAKAEAGLSYEEYLSRHLPIESES